MPAGEKLSYAKFPDRSFSTETLIRKVTDRQIGGKTDGPLRIKSAVDLEYINFMGSAKSSTTS